MISKLTTTALAAGLVLAPVAAASAVTPTAAVKSYADCPAMQKDFPGGVARNATVFNTRTVNGKKVRQSVKYRAKVNAAVYKRNAGLDRDKDGIACER